MFCGARFTMQLQQVKFYKHFVQHIFLCDISIPPKKHQKYFQKNRILFIITLSFIGTSCKHLSISLKLYVTKRCQSPYRPKKKNTKKIFLKKVKFYKHFVQHIFLCDISIPPKKHQKDFQKNNK